MIQPEEARLDFVGPPRGSGRAASPHCASCGYAITGCVTPSCAECGRAFDPQDARTFAWRPPGTFQQIWWPIAAFVLVTGLLLFAVISLLLGPGFALAVGLLWSVGAAVSYRLGFRATFRRRDALVLAALSLVVIGGMLLHQSGPQTAALVVGVMSVPITFGGLAGSGFRTWLKSTEYPATKYLP